MIEKFIRVPMRGSVKMVEFSEKEFISQFEAEREKPFLVFSAHYTHLTHYLIPYSAFCPCVSQSRFSFVLTYVLVLSLFGFSLTNFSINYWKCSGEDAFSTAKWDPPILHSGFLLISSQAWCWQERGKKLAKSIHYSSLYGASVG